MAEQDTKQKPEKKTKRAKIINCTSCNKPLKRLKRYYRDGKYYCTKKCYKKSKAGKEAS